MRKTVLLFIVAFYSCFAQAQHTFTATVKDSATQEPLTGAAVVLKGTRNGTTTDINGQATLINIPAGVHIIVISFNGYNPKELSFQFPKNESEIILLAVLTEEIDEVIVEGTRSGRSIDNIPTRVEVLTEEIDEAATMDPSKIAHLLTHSTGIQVQQTSATSNTANVRIQGLDGRYTQILKDGFPLYGGFSGSLSIMQIPPLDLRQVEYVKGSASTLYGAGAISGLINLLSKEPKKGRDETILHLNASHIGAFDVNAFTSSRKEKIGFTLLAQRNTHRFFDADSDGFSDMPELTKYNVNPRLFFYCSEKTKVTLGATITNENRQGGDTKLFGDRDPTTLHFYKEKNESNRITTQVSADHIINEASSVSIKQSLTVFHRNLRVSPSFAAGEYRFAGTQTSSFSEVAYSFRRKSNIFITGLNFYTDDFREDVFQSLVLRDEKLQTAGHFVNYTFDAGKKVSVESGLRTDYTINRKIHVLPRLSVLFKWTDKLTTRAGGGLGYRNASIFNQEAELLAYKNVLPVDRDVTFAERSYGANADIGYKTPVGEKCFISFNQMFFYTTLEKPLILADTSGSSGIYHFVNVDGFTQSYGAETFFKFGFYDFVFFAGYTFTHVTNHFSGTMSELTLTPKHSLKGDLLYALPGQWRIGADYEFKSGQKLSGGRTSPEYWTFGFVIERTWKYFTLFGNVENFTDVRQTKYESLLSLPNGTPQFTEVWAPLDGIVVNAGIKVRM